MVDSSICWCCMFFFFFNDTATTEIYTLSLHDALPICRHAGSAPRPMPAPAGAAKSPSADRKSTRLNSSHVEISYAVLCLKKKKTQADTGHGTQSSPTPGAQTSYSGFRAYRYDQHSVRLRRGMRWAGKVHFYFFF